MPVVVLIVTILDINCLIAFSTAATFKVLIVTILDINKG